MAQPIFISHATADDDFVKRLRVALESRGLTVWADSRELAGGAMLDAEIERALRHARSVIVVVSLDALNSAWVQREVKLAQEVQQARVAAGDGSYRVIPLLLPGIGPNILKLLFGVEPLGVTVTLDQPDSLDRALPQILAALGEELPDDVATPQPIDATPVAELRLEFTDPTMHESGGTRRPSATATLIYEPPAATARPVESRRFVWRAPLGALENDDLRWYLEEYYRWPVGVFAARAKAIEAQLPAWGQALYAALFNSETARSVMRAWATVAPTVERRVSIWVDRDLPEGAMPEAQALANEAATRLLGLPWELLHDGDQGTGGDTLGGYLFQGRHATAVRRRLPNRQAQPPVRVDPPIRVLLVAPRPEDGVAGYFDHRSSAQPLAAALHELGSLAALTVLTPPTLPALEEELERAARRGQPYHVLHFDGHGVYDQRIGLGALCFEEPGDSAKLTNRRTVLCPATDIAATLRRHRIPLVFLDACQGARATLDPTAAVAVRLLQEGVTSVVAMTHSVLVTSAQRFVTAFYGELATGARVGRAMLAGQRALYNDPRRGVIMGAGELRLHDWFVPVLYQEAHDPQLFTRLPNAAAQRMAADRCQAHLGALPPPPSHHFHGRSRELLALERLLAAEAWAVIRGQGGMGKTTLAVELARWLAATNRVERIAFASVEGVSDPRGILDALGRQLLPDYTVAQYPDLKTALQPIERALRDATTLIVIDNLESILDFGLPIADVGLSGDEESKIQNPKSAILSLCQALLHAAPTTRLLFTSREALPAPFDRPRHLVTLGALSRGDAVALVSQVMADHGWTPPPTDAGRTPDDVAALVEAVNRHPRALVLLAREVTQQGVTAATADLAALMAELERKHPGDPENSLYASLELSLRRLLPEMQELIKPLAVFHDGCHPHVMTEVLELRNTQHTSSEIANGLVNVGLATVVDDFYLRLDPALPAYLRRQLDAAALETATLRWAEAMQQLCEFLYTQHFKDAQLAARLTLLELSNLLALLAWAAEQAPPETTVNLATMLETLLQYLHRPQALVQVVAVRQRTSAQLGAWSHQAFIAQRAAIERLLEDGNLHTALEAAQALLDCCQAGAYAYNGADYDSALAYSLLGKVLLEVGAAQRALPYLQEAQHCLQNLANEGNNNAGIAAALNLTDQGNCLVDLGNLEAAASVYLEVIQRSEKQAFRRLMAVANGQLATVYRLQRRYAEALAGYAEAQRIFNDFNEPKTTAVIWHQIGIVYSEIGDLTAAERAYRNGLQLHVQIGDLSGQAGGLIELGSLYACMNRLEDAVDFYRQAIDLYVRLQNHEREGLARSNMADKLLKLRQYDMARRELDRAIECKKPFGHVATTRVTYHILHNLEITVGNLEAAFQARQQAMSLYRSYRVDGGESQSNRAGWFAGVQQALAQGQAAQAKAELLQVKATLTAEFAIALIDALVAVLDGGRDPALAADARLDYQDAVEVGLLLAAVGQDTTTD